MGVKPTFRALQKAKQKGLDLVIVNPNSEPPVARICDYHKMEFQKLKRQKNGRKKNTANEMKSLQMRYKIDTSDYITKLNQAKKFLDKGFRVQIECYCRGREIAFFNLVEDLRDRVVDDLDSVATIERQSCSPRKITITFKRK